MSARRAGAARPAVAVLAAAATLLAGCSVTLAPTPVAPTPAFAWTPCGDLECARVPVPRDPPDPRGPPLALAVARRAATRTPRLGTLFVNPGGPGASGRSMVLGVPSEGLGQFDVVGWDPRGVGESSAVTCLTGGEADAHLALDASPDTPAEADALLAGARAFGRSCLERTGADLLARVSTVDTARDLDALRAAAGDERLTYLGVSYGTRLGATYAALFPDRVRRMVLDAPVDPSDDPAVPQAAGFDRALARFAGWCAGTPSCGLGAEPDAVVAGLRADLDALDASPLPVGDRALSQTLAATGLALHLYGGSSGWPALADGVRALRRGEGGALLAAADQLNGRRPDGSYGGLFGSFRAIVCADSPRQDRSEADRRWASDREAAPFFGTYLGPEYLCGDWPVAPVAGPGPGVVAGGPILVVGTTGDPATPSEWAGAAADALRPSVLLTVEGEGHGSFGRGNDCVDAAATGFLAGGDLPASGTTCR